MHNGCIKSILKLKRNNNSGLSNVDTDEFYRASTAILNPRINADSGLKYSYISKGNYFFKLSNHPEERKVILTKFHFTFSSVLTYFISIFHFVLIIWLKIEKRMSLMTLFSNFVELFERRQLST